MHTILWGIVITLLVLTGGNAHAMAKEGCGGDCSSCHTLTLKEAGTLLEGIGKVTQVRVPSVRGLWEVELQKDGKKAIAFVDYGKKHLIPGPIYSLTTKQPITGAQAGIVTDGVHTKARIQNITPKKIHELLDQGNIVIVAGFQGQTIEGQVTTLGRGGSDLTAIALAAALKADLCQIYTDVDGVYTADPRIVPSAQKLEEISYDEMLELASLGAKVMQSRSVEFAKKFGVVFEVRSSLNETQEPL